MAVDDLNEKLAAFGMRLEFWPTEKLAELLKKTKNPKKHYNDDIAKLESAMRELGFKNVVYIDRDATEIPAGAGRIMAATRAGFPELPVFRLLDLSKAKVKKFRIVDNRLKSEKYDEKILLADLKELKIAGEDLTYLDYQAYERQLAAEMGATEAGLNQAIQDMATGHEFAAVGDVYRAPGGELGSEEPAKQSLPPVSSEASLAARANGMQRLYDIDLNVVFPSDNVLEIPTLSLEMQAQEVVPPLIKWGEIARAAMTGTGMFYVIDSKFASLRNNPLTPLETKCVNFVEPNFSTGPNISIAQFIGELWLKRFCARLWESQGIRIFVDMNVDKKFHRLNVGGEEVELDLLGVPKGWGAYFTRGLSSYIDCITEDYERACARAGRDNILFAVYGGGKDVQALCERQGWPWFQERMQEVSSGKVTSGLGLKVDPSKYADLK